MTPFELSIYVDAYREKMNREQENLITQAYLTAYWQRVKKMPNLREVLKSKPKKKQMTDQQLFNMARALNAAFGGTDSIGKGAK